MYPVDVTIYSGMSGAPLLSSDNSVIGVFSGSYTEGRGIGWAIPIKYALDLMSQPQMGRRADQIGAWPSLTLMNSRWISLKRSYDQPFEPEHIAELEILEQARGRRRTDSPDLINRHRRQQLSPHLAGTHIADTGDIADASSQ